MKIVEEQTEPPVAIKSITRERAAQDKGGRRTQIISSTPGGAVRPTTARPLRSCRNIHHCCGTCGMKESTKDLESAQRCRLLTPQLQCSLSMGYLCGTAAGTVGYNSMLALCLHRIVSTLHKSQCLHCRLFPF